MRRAEGGEAEGRKKVKLRKGNEKFDKSKGEGVRIRINERRLRRRRKTEKEE